ncbi:MAG TPA: type II toxin-antitoxin system PemK/MazF family toxin [Xanthobacteraceae bacterium]|jgi:mRNA interferase MazF
MTTALMATFNPWDVVKVPFPYTDRPARQHRPALVVAAGSIQAGHGLLWVLMITSAENRRWADDVLVANLNLAGLPAPSVIRCAKIATIEARDAERIGAVAQRERGRVTAHLARILGGVAAIRR